MNQEQARLALDCGWFEPGRNNLRLERPSLPAGCLPSASGER